MNKIKYLIVALAIVLGASACSGGSSSSKTVCSGTIEGTKGEVTGSFKSDQLNTMDVKMIIDDQASMEALKDYDEKKIEELFASSFPTDDVKGFTFGVKKTDKSIEITMSFDFSKISFDNEIVTSFFGNLSEKDVKSMTKKRFTTEMEDIGLTCK